MKDLGLDDRHQEAENGSTATDADSVGASGSTADRSSKRDQGRQAYEATRNSVFDRLGTARAFGSDNAAQAESAQPYLGQAAPCFLAAAKWCFDLRIVDKHDRPVTECTMQRRGGCDRPHDEESCLRLWNNNSERGVKFRQQLGAYVKIVVKNDMREPNKEQLQEAGVLPNWNAKKLKSKDRSETDVLLREQWETLQGDKKPKQSGVGWQASRQQHRRPDEKVRRSDLGRTVSVFAAPRVFAHRKDSVYGGRRDVAFTAVLDESAVATDGASYQLSAGGAPAQQEPATVDGESSDGSTSSDDGDLPC